MIAETTFGAQRRAHQAVPARAGRAVLDLRVPAADHGCARHRLSQPGPDHEPGRRRSPARERQRARRPWPLAGDGASPCAILEPAAPRAAAARGGRAGGRAAGLAGGAVRLPLRSHAARRAGRPPAGRRAPAAPGRAAGSVGHPRRDRGGARRPLRRLAGAGPARDAAAQRRHVGRRLQHRERAPAQAAQAPGRHAHAAQPLPAVVPASRACCSCPFRSSSCSRSPASPSG